MRFPRGRLWALAILMASVVGWSLWPTARSLAVEVRDEFGMRLVEGHAATIVAAAHDSGVDPSLLAGIMFIESHGRGGQTSSAGALAGPYEGSRPISRTKSAEKPLQMGRTAGTLKRSLGESAVVGRPVANGC